MNVEAKMRFLKVPTARQPEGAIEAQLSTVGVGIGDGDGSGAIALFTGPGLHSLLGQMVAIAVQGGLIEPSPVHIENLGGAPGGLN